MSRVRPIPAPEHNHLHNSARTPESFCPPVFVIACKFVSLFPNEQQKGPQQPCTELGSRPGSRAAVCPASRRGHADPREVCSQQQNEAQDRHALSSQNKGPSSSILTATLGFRKRCLSGESRSRLRPVASTGVRHRRPQGPLPAPGPGRHVPAWLQDAGRGPAAVLTPQHRLGMDVRPPGDS